MIKGLKVLFLVTEDWYFTSHRLNFAVRLQEAGYQISVGCRFSGKEKTIRSQGIHAFPVSFTRESTSFAKALEDCFAVRRLIKTVQPHLVHLVALRPIVVGGLAGLGLPRVPMVNAITGLGSLFTGDFDTWRLRGVQFVITRLLRPTFCRSTAWNVFQNREDLATFLDRGYSRRENSILIHGAGVDPSVWRPLPEPATTLPIVLFVGRLLKEKGLGELVEASRQLRLRGLNHTLRVVGSPDGCNPKSFTEQQIRAWQHEGALEWLGRREDVLEQMSQANVIAMPSYYREGLPKVLLESGLAERAVVTCDVIGCREVVENGVNGLLVPPRNVSALTDAIEQLLENPTKRRQFAQRHRQRVCEEFSLSLVTEKFLALYQKILCPPTTSGLLSPQIESTRDCVHGSPDG